MKIGKCRRCGKILPGEARAICPNCRKDLDIAYERVRSFLKENPDMSFRRTDLRELAKRSEVPERDIELLIEEGILELEGAQAEADEERAKKEQLLKDFQSSLSGSGNQKKTLSYGKERHGR
ncbi:MAG TPA: hypothetical protein PK364_03510 [Synergistaceae bacterium]|nr:hypothetical protein [Synergistaceae bacterium]HPJ26198.1 hypothetical protein [Synergistaceae bacterium]HPQ36548.1 hypothetical protein [Synergistaceae bacterium]